MYHDFWFYAFCASVALGGAWSIFRECQIARLSRELYRFQSLMKTIAKRISSARAETRKEFADIRALIDKTANQQQLDRIELSLHQKQGPLVQVSTGDNAANQAGENKHEQR